MEYYNNLSSVTRCRQANIFFVDFGLIDCIIIMGGFYFSNFKERRL